MTYTQVNTVMSAFTQVIINFLALYFLLITDIGRTFPDNIYFTHEKNDLRPALFNVLVAYAKYDPRIGYCQVCKAHYKQIIETG